MVNKGNHPQMALIQVRYYFTQMVVVFVWISDHFWVFVDISSFKKVRVFRQDSSEVFAVPFVTEVNLKGFKNSVEMF